ncbi:hypothetical protein F5B20DRAFT_522089 [Whalleya microplaca]|nr:hypothetical protein F5B20DRAFT_522089 [Whalleya microplaca]
MSAEATAVMATAPELDHGHAHDRDRDHEHDHDHDHDAGVEIQVASGPCNNDNEKDADARNGNNDSSSNKQPTGLHSPPDSNSAMKLDGSDDSELSDLEDPSIIDDTLNIGLNPIPASPQPDSDDSKVDPEQDEDIGEVLPDHWSGTVPVFKPDMHQFKDFRKFMTKVDPYGMKSGIIKIIPPQEWKEQLQPIDDLVKQVRVKEPIKQDIMGSNGTYRQVNILHQRSYNLPQWRALCDQSEHQPPARRGERRAQAPPKPKLASASTATGSRRTRRTTRGKGKRGAAAKDSTAEQEERPMTPVSPKPTEEVVDSLEQDDPGADVDTDGGTPLVGRVGGSRQARPKTQSTSARRKFARREASARIDEEAFREFDYRMDISDYTPERCEELERIYWKTLTYAPPLYGADLPGTLFDDGTECWNLNKLPNLLDVLGTKVPGVNTAYLYLGMWKATFAWHLEDVDLYSINYLHFGAPKQWYSISQGDARRFEAAMKSIWPTEAKACDQFLRHKAFLISPNHLQQYFNIKVNRCVSYPGEFVVTYPYGYHSGYNLGYNCAEAVNFALDSWLPMGKIAKKCECAQAQDSVWVDVYEIERKLRGEETDYEETEDEEEDEDEDEEEGDAGLPIPRSSHAVKFKQAARKRKRVPTDKGERKAKKIRLRLRNHVEPPCCLCPHDIPGAQVLPTDDGRKAHRICALYGPETWIETVDDKEIIANVENISKARLDLKCLYCRSKRGACFQCSQKKCARSYHATCAAAAGVLVEEAEVPVFGEDGTEYKEQAFEFSCRFHRSKRDRKLDGDALDECKKTRQAASALKQGDICQVQYYRGDIFAGVIVENRHDEHTFLLDIIPNGDRIEVEWKWLLLPDPADFHLPKASPNAIPMPTSRKAKDRINATKRQTEELPRADAPFVDGFTWAEFNAYDCTNKAQAKVDLSGENQMWYYLGRTSTEARAQYTEDPKNPRHNARSNFLDTIPRPAPPPAVQPRKPYGSTFAIQPHPAAAPKTEKPYQYKPRTPIIPSYIQSPYTAQHFTPKPSPFTVQQFIPKLSPYTPTPTSQTSQTSQNPPHYLSQKPLQHHTQQLPQQTRPNPAPVPKPSSYVSQQTAQQSVPKPAPVSKPTPSQGGHKRNRSSLSSQNGQGLAFGSDPRFRTPPFSYGSGRFDANAKSPFSHGFMQPPGLGPSPSPQNGQLFQAQARARSGSLASNRSFDTPMTSSAIRPPSSASSGKMVGPSQSATVALQNNITKQARPSIVQKYAFFQVHHNRDSTKYRTPYAHWGGFTNGYEGNLRAHLMRTPDALFDVRRQSIGLSGGVSGVSSGARNPFTNGLPTKDPTVSVPHITGPNAPQQANASPAYSSPRPYGAETTPLSTPSSASHAQPNVRRLSINGANPWDTDRGSAGQLHPAIRAHYAAMLQKRNSEVQEQLMDARTKQGEANQSPISAASTPSQAPVRLAAVPALSASPSLGQRITSTPSSELPVSTPSPITKPPSVPPKQTYVPPPRPWETLRRAQPMGQQPLHFSPASMSTAPASPAVTPATPSPFSTNGYENPRHLPSPGLGPSNPQPTQSQAASVDTPHAQPRPAAERSPVRAPPVPATTSQCSAPALRHPVADAVPPAAPATAATAAAPATSAAAATFEIESITPEHLPLPLPPAVATTEELVDAPQGSMELVENIIRNAQMASSSSSLLC